MPWTVLSPALATATCLLLAVVMDHAWGEPAARWHPVVWTGRYLAAAGRKTTHDRPAVAFTLGALAWCAGAALSAALAWGVQATVFHHVLLLVTEGGTLRLVYLVLSWIVMAWLLKAMFSWRMLLDEAQAVETALQTSLAAGRQRLSMLVSRDTANLSEAEVRESAIESLAENLNDAIVAPIFWFVLLGLPGAAVYRFANTADAMWGYRGLRDGVDWEWAGKWAARADDVLSWVPARLTAWLLSAAHGRGEWERLRHEARKTPSPNSGWPMAAMAIALGVRLGKPGVYLLNAAGRVAASADTVLARKKASKAATSAILWAQAAIVLIAAGRLA
ncbi:MAG: adenosylcobinamide-phosphate synthase [Polaromonas sp.]|nr:adenosylcobinamide-phosphate synthase [Polaromonas sp.]